MELEKGLPCQVETYVCTSCGYEFLVETIPSGPSLLGMPQATLFVGCYIVSCGPTPAKAFILLKRLLAPYQHFQLARLESQFMAESPIWRLGVFYDSEVEALRNKGSEMGLQLEFVRDEAT